MSSFVSDPTDLTNFSGASDKLLSEISGCLARCQTLQRQINTLYTAEVAEAIRKVEAAAADADGDHEAAAMTSESTGGQGNTSRPPLPEAAKETSAAGGPGRGAAGRY